MLILQHPKLKNYSIIARVSEGVAKKCGKQEEQAAYLSKNDLRYVACGFKKYYINRPEEIKQQFHVVNGFS
jgi:hypothetical protein